MKEFCVYIIRYIDYSVALTIMLASMFSCSVDALFTRTQPVSTVALGKLYRSGQLTNQALAQAVRRYGIRHVLCLWRTKPTIRKERNMLENAGITYIHVRMSPSSFPTRMQIETLLECIDERSGPLLVHCRQGIDRTGLFCGLWLLEKGYGLSRACAQLSWWQFGHWRIMHPKLQKFLHVWHQMRMHYHDRSTMLVFYEQYRRLHEHT